MQKTTLPTIRDLTSIYGISAVKTLSQNFIMDFNVSRKICRCASNPKFATLEIGPGLGSLSRSALELGASRLILIEKDARFLPILNQLSGSVEAGRVTILNRDVLTVPQSLIVSLLKDGEGLNILANLPFNISTVLLCEYLHLIANQKGMNRCILMNIYI